MSTTDYINDILEILQLNDFSHLFVPSPFKDSSSCIKKLLILTVSSPYIFTLNLRSLLLSALIAVPMVITSPKGLDPSTLSISPLALSLLSLSSLITDIYAMTVLPISLKTFLFSSTTEKQPFLMFSLLFLKCMKIIPWLPFPECMVLARIPCIASSMKISIFQIDSTIFPLSSPLTNLRQPAIKEPMPSTSLTLLPVRPLISSKIEKPLSSRTISSSFLLMKEKGQDHHHGSFWCLSVHHAFSFPSCSDYM